MFCKKSVLTYFASARVSFNKAACLRSATLSEHFFTEHLRGTASEPKLNCIIISWKIIPLVKIKIQEHCDICLKIKHLFKVNNKGTKLTSRTWFLWLIEDILMTWSIIFVWVFIVNVRKLKNSYFQKYIRNVSHTAQKMKFSIKDFYSKCDQIRTFQRISHFNWRNL